MFHGMDLRIVISMNNSLQTVPSQQLKRYNKYWLCVLGNMRSIAACFLVEWLYKISSDFNARQVLIISEFSCLVGTILPLSGEAEKIKTFPEKIEKDTY